MVNAENISRNPNNTLTSSFGFWDGTNSVTCSATSQYGGGFKEARRYISDSAFFSHVSAAAVNRVERWDISGITDGIQIDLAFAPIPLDWQRQIFVLIFNDLTNVEAGLAEVATLGSVNMGWRPKFLLCAGAGIESTTAGSSEAHSASTLGIATDADQYSLGLGSEDQSGATDAYRNSRDKAASTLFNYLTSWEADIDITPTGFDFLNVVGTPAGDDIMYLAFDIPNSVLLQERDAVTFASVPGDGKVSTTGVGWRPQLAINMSICSTTSAPSDSTHASMAVGACDETLAQHSTHSRGGNNLSNANFSGAIKLDHGLWIPIPTSPWTADEPLARYDSFDADGFTLEYITPALANVRKYVQLLVEENTGPGEITDTGDATWTAPFVAIATLADTGNATWTAPFTAGITLTDTGNATWTAPFTATPTLADIGATTWTAPFSATPTILDSGSTTWTAPFDVGASVTDIGDTIWTAPFSAVATLTDSGNATWTAPFDATVVVGDTGISTWTALFIAIPTLADIGISTWTAPFDVGVILTDTGVSTWTAPFNVLATLLDSGVATWTAPFNATTTTTLLDTGSTTWTAPFSIELLYGAVYAEVSWVIEVQPNGIVWHPN